jgi:hypothetical protein
MPFFNLNDNDLGNLAKAAGNRWDRVRGILGLLGDKADDLEAEAGKALDNARAATEAAVVAAAAAGKIVDEAVDEVTKVVDKAAADAKVLIGEVAPESPPEGTEPGEGSGSPSVEGGAA